MENRRSLSDGFLRRNAVLSKGMVIAPIVACCDMLPKALMLSLVFAIVTILTVTIGSFYPKKLVYTMRIVLYAVTAAVIFIPAAMLCQFISPSVYGALGSMSVPGQGIVPEAAAMYLPLLSVNSFIVLHSELHFYHMRKPVMLLSLIAHTAGFCVAACACAAVRELLAHGSIAGHVVDIPLLMRGFAAPWGGFIVLGVLCALHRVIFRKKVD